MFTESNDPIEKISDLMPSTQIEVGGANYNFSFEEYPGIQSSPSTDRAFIYQEENQVDKLFQLTPDIPKSEAYNALKSINMQDPTVISSLISKGIEVVKRCNEIDTSKIPIMILQEKIEIDGKPFTITYLPENSMYRETYEKRIRNRIKRVGE